MSIFFELLYPAKLHPELTKISLEYYQWCNLELSKECKIFLHQNYISHVWHHVRRPFTILSQKLDLIFTYVLHPSKANISLQNSFNKSEHEQLCM